MQKRKVLSLERKSERMGDGKLITIMISMTVSGILMTV